MGHICIWVIITNNLIWFDDKTETKMNLFISFFFCLYSSFKLIQATGSLSNGVDSQDIHHQESKRKKKKR